MSTKETFNHKEKEQDVADKREKRLIRETKRCHKLKKVLYKYSITSWVKFIFGKANFRTGVHLVYRQQI